MFSIRTRKYAFLPTLILSALMATATVPAVAGQGPGPRAGMSGGDRPMMMCGKHGRGPGCRHRGHGKRHLLGEHWKNSLTAEQKLELDKLHLAFAKQKAPLKAGMKALKVQLAVLSTADQFAPEALEAKINELVMAKREMLRAKASYIAAQRQVLTPEQRVSFDMGTVHKAMHGKKGHGHHCGMKR